MFGLLHPLRVGHEHSSWCEWSQGSAGAVWDGLSTLVAEALDEDLVTRANVRPCVDQLVSKGGDQLAAILFYGSCLFSHTQTGTSFPDFYLLVDDLDRFHRSPLHALLNRVLPPNAYYATAQERRFKYCVVSTAQFLAEASPRASDIHHLGRFSKRIAIAYSRDEQARRTVLEGSLSAMLTLTSYALSQLPSRFTLEQFLLKQLGISYVGEQRVVEPQKVLALLEGARQFYDEIYPSVLELHRRRCGFPVHTGGDRYQQPPPTPAQRRRTDRFVRRSRHRGMLRWPKYILTVDEWADYLIDKFERHHGVHLELTERQRRHPLIFGWPLYFEMRRRGLVR